MNRSPPLLALEKFHASSQFSALAKARLQARDGDPIRCRRWLRAQLGQALVHRDSVLSESSDRRPLDPAIFLMSCPGWNHLRQPDRNPSLPQPTARAEDKPGWQSLVQLTRIRPLRPSRPSPGCRSLAMEKALEPTRSLRTGR